VAIGLADATRTALPSLSVARYARDFAGVHSVEELTDA